MPGRVTNSPASVITIKSMKSDRAPVLTIRSDRRSISANASAADVCSLNTSSRVSSLGCRAGRLCRWIHAPYLRIRCSRLGEPDPSRAQGRPGSVSANSP